MNCKPGDLAIVVSHNQSFNGRLVEVLYAPPSHSFTLPDGYQASAPDEEPSWVLKAVGYPWEAPLIGGGMRQCWYGVGADTALRPLRGDPDEVHEDEEMTV